MSAPRGLTPEEAALWEKVAATVVPLPGKRRPAPAAVSASTPKNIKKTPQEVVISLVKPPKGRVPAPRVPVKAPPPPVAPLSHQGLDSSWDRKLSRGVTVPDFTLDLHGATLDSAYVRLDNGLIQAKAMGARVVLLVTGKPRGASAADRGNVRGAIRAKVLDWLAAGSHASDIAAVRTAHRRHGGDGALYLILRRRR